MDRSSGRNQANYSSSGGRSSRSRGRFPRRSAPIGADGLPNNDPFSSQARSSQNVKLAFEKSSLPSRHEPVSDYSSQRDSSCGGNNISPKVGLHELENLPMEADSSSNQYGQSFASYSSESGSKDCKTMKSVNYMSRVEQTLPHEAGGSKALHQELPQKMEISHTQVEPQMAVKSGIINRPCENNRPRYGQASHEVSPDNKNPEQSQCPAKDPPFDICPAKVKAPVMLKPSLLVKNREKRNEMKRSLEGQKGTILRPGMVLLKSYLSKDDQAKIVKSCRDLGVGIGGFYQPGYRDGAKLLLRMMCLGKNWDPETSQYEDNRSADGAKPPAIPNLFNQLVKQAIEYSHSHLRETSKATDAEDILPWMSPDICIVNFYTSSGRLGLHQDRDESPDSLQKGLPVVSFSIGDSADFLYGDERDVGKADKVVLKSGDVLIFGGKSRHVFHGVTAIHPNSAPKTLLEETGLRPGRLNLTFRQY